MSVANAYHLLQNHYSYKSEIKSKTIGLYQITGVTVFILNRKQYVRIKITGITGVTDFI